MLFLDLKSFALGIEFGSTRIKAVLLDENRKVAVSGSHTWENKLIDGVWTYDLEDIISGMQACYTDLRQNFEEKYGEKLTEVGAIGISGMMHGYLPFDKKNNLLTRFRTWRNTMTAEAVEILVKAFNFPIPERWSIAHLYKDILDKRPYVKDIAFFTTLAGFIHWRLTGEKVLGIGEASGMFPINSSTGTYNSELINKFEELTAESDFVWKLEDILPTVLSAGKNAGYLTKDGARLLDTSGNLKAGIPFAPPEGDAGTGMVATNSVRVGTGNVSAGTSIFAMVVVDKMPALHKEINMVTTPSGEPVAMVHCTNCTSDLNDWASLLKDFTDKIGMNISIGKIFDLIFETALEGRPDCGGLLSYNYYSGEANTGLDKGVPLFMHSPDSDFGFANFARCHLYSCLATLKIGLDILIKENIKIDRICGHGGYFKAPVTGQKFLSAAVGAPVITLETAGEGGPYGMAILAAYLLDNSGEELADYLETEIFKDSNICEISAEQADIDGFNTFMEYYKKALVVEKCAVENFSV